MAMFRLLKIRTSIDIFKNEKSKVTFGLEYIYASHLFLLFILNPQLIYIIVLFHKSMLKVHI